MIRTCPRCGDFYADSSLLFCPADGMPLADLDTHQETWAEATRVVEEKGRALRRQTRRLRLRRVMTTTTSVLITTLVVFVVAFNTYVYLSPAPVAPVVVAALTPTPTPTPRLSEAPIRTPTADSPSTPFVPAVTPTPTPEATPAPDRIRNPAGPANTVDTSTPTPTPTATPIVTETPTVRETPLVEEPPRTPTPTPTRTPDRKHDPVTPEHDRPARPPDEPAQIPGCRLTLRLVQSSALRLGARAHSKPRALFDVQNRRKQMSLRESSATALVRFTGLGIICFNKEKARGEVAVIRDDKHALSVKIQRPVFQDGGDGDVIVYQDVAAYGGLPKEGVTVNIESAGAPEGYEIYRGGEFDRLDSPDPHDFRWIVHVDSLHADTAVRPTGQRRHPLTKLYIAGGLFYTHSLDTDLFFEKLEKDAAGRVTSREVFGNVGETMGVKLEGEEVFVRVSVGGREETHTLKRVEGLPYRVEIKNMDYSDTAVYSDMADYYGYLASPDGSRFDLSPMKDEEDDARAAGGAVNQREFCHPIATDLDTIDSL